MPQQTPLHFVFYIAAPPTKVWDGFVSPESNRILFATMGGMPRWQAPARTQAQRRAAPTRARSSAGSPSGNREAPGSERKTVDS